MLDAENHVVQQSNLRTHYLKWARVFTGGWQHLDNKVGPTGSLLCLFRLWKSHLRHGTGSLWPSSALLHLSQAMHLGEQELHLFPTLAPSVQSWEKEL